MTLYLIRAGCPRCGEVASLVEETSGAFPVDADVPVDTRWCPECGEQVRMGEWDVAEETEVERVAPTDPHAGREPEDTSDAHAVLREALGDDADPPTNPVQRVARGLSSHVEGGIEVAPCPSCGSLSTYWDELADEDTESGYCEDCGASFALSETVVVGEGDVEEGSA